jgi:ABC-type Zn uptake system ZnuABC Zn-binding protein ZnuA
MITAIIPAIVKMRTILIGVLVAAAVAGCGSSDSNGRPSIAATTGIVADIARQVAGPDAGVEQLIPDATSPHEFQLSAGDRRTLEDVSLVVANGADLEAGVPLDDVDSPTWELAGHAGRLRPFGADEPAEPAGEEEEPHGAFDPHVWMDPRRVADALPSLAAALAEADPEHARGYRARAREYAERLRALDADIRARVAAIPKRDRQLVTSHDALGYFADRYGFEVVATPFPASGPEAEPSAARARRRRASDRGPATLARFTSPAAA